MPSIDAIGFGFGIGSRPFGVAACAVLAAATSSIAQNSEQSYVVAQGDGVQLRCGQGAGFYATQEVATGQILLVTEQNGLWLRVQYPARSEAYVSANAVEVSGPWATLTADVSLRHVNPRAGKRGSWKPLYDSPLPIGTKLAVVAFEDNAKDQYKAYRVMAPRGAQAYIEASAVRPATADEVSLYLASVGSIGGGLSGPDDLIRRDVTVIGDDDAIVPGIELPGEDVGSVPVPAVLLPQEIELKSGSADQLEAAFQAVRRQPIAEAEYGEMIAEYRRALESLDGREANVPLRMAYQQRLDLLLMQQKFQEARRAASVSLSELEANSKTVTMALDALDKNRRYVVIGRLTTSVVYNGERLPLMYRIQSVGDRIPRTLGYLRPNKAFDLNAKVGRIVGVEGETLLDQSLKLNVVTPTRVDVLTPSADGSLSRSDESAAETQTETPAQTPAQTTDKATDKKTGG